MQGKTALCTLGGILGHCKVGARLRWAAERPGLFGVTRFQQDLVAMLRQVLTSTFRALDLCRKHYRSRS